MISQPDVFGFIPVMFVQTLHWLAGLTVFAESINKLERTMPFASGLSGRTRAAVCLQSMGWWWLCAGSAGALLTPLLHLEPPTLQDAAVMAGIAVLIIRKRFQENIT